MKKLSGLIMFLYLFALIYSCQSILEQNIEGQKVYLNSPVNGLVSDNYNQTLWWDKVQGASKYNLQVISPSFEYMRKLVLDTNISSNQFTMTFYPDTFTWRVKAINDAFETEYSQAVFYIDSTEGPQIPILREPDNKDATNDFLIEFKWYQSANAENYRILIKEGERTIASSISIKTSFLIPNVDYDIDMLEDGEYTWSVRAENVQGISEYSDAFKLIVDRTAPQKPIITKPTAHDTVSEFNMAWDRPSSTVGSAIKDSLIVYSDSSGTNIYLSLKTDSTVYNHSGARDSWYRFKVKSVDAAGNESSWSDIRYFYFKEGSSEE